MFENASGFLRVVAKILFVLSVILMVLGVIGLFLGGIGAIGELTELLGRIGDSRRSTAYAYAAGTENITALVAVITSIAPSLALIFGGFQLLIEAFVLYVIGEIPEYCLINLVQIKKVLQCVSKEEKA